MCGGILIWSTACKTLDDSFLWGGGEVVVLAVRVSHMLPTCLRIPPQRACCLTSLRRGVVSEGEGRGEGGNPVLPGPLVPPSPPTPLPPNHQCRCVRETKQQVKQFFCESLTSNLYVDNIKKKIILKTILETFFSKKKMAKLFI